MPFSAIDAGQHRRRVEMREGGRRRRVGQIVGRHVDRLHRGDRALGGRGDALLQRAHVGGERRLVADGARDAAEQRRHFRAGLREAEDVVDEEQHVLALVAEILGDGQAGEADAGARARRLVHLAEDQRAFGAGGRAVVLVRVLVDAGLDHLVIEVVALARALADAGEHRIAAMRLGDVVDELLDQHRLADAGAAEEADLAAARIGREQVDDLDAGDEDLRLGRLVDIGRRVLMDGAPLGGLHRARLVHRLADDVHDAAERLVADRHGDRLAGVAHRLAAHEPLAGIHGDGAHGVLAEMLRDFEHQAVAVIVGLQRVQDGRQRAVELHVHHGAHHLRDLAGQIAYAAAIIVLVVMCRPPAQTASAPEMISISSLVICAWRWRL